MTRWQWTLASVSAGVAGLAGVLGASGCSSSSSGAAGSDAAVEAAPFDPATYDAAIGVGMPMCTPSHCILGPTVCGTVVNCPSPGICGGTLAGPQQPITYCTLACSTNADCPSGAGCETKLTSGHCLKTCTSDTECSGGFGCHHGGDAGDFCWSPFSGADAVPEAGADSGEAGAEAGPAEAGGSDGGAPSDAAGGDGGAVEAGPGDGGADAASEAAGD